MDNFTSLKSSLQAIQQIINLDVVPAFDDLSNNSLIFNDLISAQTNIQLELNNIDLLINSNVIKGDIGLTGDDGYTPIKGVDYFDGIDGLSFVLSQLILTVPSNVANSTTTLAQIAPLLSSDFVANAVYEISVYIQFTTPITTTGLSLALAVPSNAVFYGETSIAMTTVGAVTAPFRLASPNSSKSMITTISSGVQVANSVHNAFINGIIKTNALGASLLCVPLFASEVAGSAVTIQAGSFLILKRIA